MASCFAVVARQQCAFYLAGITQSGKDRRKPVHCKRESSWEYLGNCGFSPRSSQDFSPPYWAGK
eukprot:scaffold154953_cov108-Cyclotella_meneghiniana.AAC.1